jgi:hypothetical protein
MYQPETVDQTAKKPPLSSIFDEATCLEGYSDLSGAISSIDKDQAVDDESGKAFYSQYRLTVASGDFYWYSAEEMEAFAKTW